MKNFKFILFNLLLVWLITNAADCGGGGNPKPVACTDENTVKFPQDALDRFYFKEGSFWVYTDSTSRSMYDSVWVYSDGWGASSKKEDGHYKNKCYEGGGGHNKSIYGELNFGISCISVLPFDDSEIKYENEIFRVLITNLTNGTLSIDRFLLKGNEYDTRFTGEVSFLDSTVVNSTKYKDILKLHYPGQHSDFLNDGYWAKNIGLIKYTDLNGIVWELTNYYVIQ